MQSYYYWFGLSLNDGGETVEARPAAVDNSLPSSPPIVVPIRRVQSQSSISNLSEEEAVNLMNEHVHRSILLLLRYVEMED